MSAARFGVAIPAARVWPPGPQFTPKIERYVHEFTLNADDLYCCSADLGAQLHFFSARLRVNYGELVEWKESRVETA
jgi:hypothetical protein